MKVHNIFIGDKIERSIEIIGEESDEHDSWELLSKYAEEGIDPQIELRGNYLRVSLEEEL